MIIIIVGDMGILVAAAAAQHSTDSKQRGNNAPLVESVLVRRSLRYVPSVPFVLFVCRVECTDKAGLLNYHLQERNLICKCLSAPNN